MLRSIAISGSMVVVLGTAFPSRKELPQLPVPLLTCNDQCKNEALWYDGTLKSGHYDGAHCRMTGVDLPEGYSHHSVSKIGNTFYLEKKHCPAGATKGLSGIYDGANCRMDVTYPSGANLFEWNGNMYYGCPTSADCCIAPAHHDGANCQIEKIPTGTTAFIHNNKWYTGTKNGCRAGLAQPGNFDQYYCLLYSSPAGTNPFVYSNKLYWDDNSLTNGFPSTPSLLSPADGDYAVINDPGMPGFVWLSFQISPNSQALGDWQVQVQRLSGTTTWTTIINAVVFAESHNDIFEADVGTIQNEYRWRVRARSEACWSGWSAWSGFMGDLVVGR